MIQKLGPSTYFVVGDDSCGPNPKIGLILGSKISCLVDVSNQKPLLEEGLAFVHRQTPSAIIKVILTHFHPDHIDNLRFLPENIEVFATKNTSRYLSRAFSLVSGETRIDVGDREIHLYPVPSLHAKGCLDVQDGGFLFVGDALFSHEKSGSLFYNREIVVEMTKKYEAMDFETAIPSHQSPFLKKKEVMALLHDLLRNSLKSSN